MDAAGDTLEAAVGKLHGLKASDSRELPWPWSSSTSAWNSRKPGESSSNSYLLGYIIIAGSGLLELTARPLPLSKVQPYEGRRE